MCHLQITEWLKAEAQNHSDIASLISIGKSFEGRDMNVLKISKSNDTKPIVFLEASKFYRKVAPRKLSNKFHNFVRLL